MAKFQYENFSPAALAPAIARFGHGWRGRIAGVKKAIQAVADQEAYGPAEVEEAAMKIGSGLRSVLDQLPGAGDHNHDELVYAVEVLEAGAGGGDEDEFNEALEHVYDYGDAERVIIE